MPCCEAEANATLADPLFAGLSMRHASVVKARMRLGDFLIAYLRRAEVDRIFGIPGDLVLRLFSALEDQHFWRMITFSHEPAVGFAADGYARATGRLGVACVT